MAKLTKAQVPRVKKDIAEDKLTQPEIAKKYHVSRSLISNIATGRAYKDVPGPEAPPKGARGQGKKVPAYDPSDQRILELEADVVHLRDERNHARRKLQVAAKTQGLFKAVVDEMDTRVKPFKSLPRARPSYKAGRNILLLSIL